MIQFDEQIDPEMLGPDGTLDYKEEKEQINFIVVGPITDPAKRITGDMLSLLTEELDIVSDCSRRVRREVPHILTLPTPPFR